MNRMKRPSVPRPPVVLEAAVPDSEDSAVVGSAGRVDVAAAVAVRAVVRAGAAG
jgi:hypothetical protein